MEYLCIANPGEADPVELTTLGVGGNPSDCRIGQFHSGAKHAVLTLLRNQLYPTIVCGRHRLTFGTRPLHVKGRQHQRVFVTHSGTKNRIQELDYTLEWGVSDWTEVGMALREFVANALDSAWEATGSYAGTSIRTVSQISGMGGWTQVYVPLTAEVAEWRDEINQRFLHFTRKSLLSFKCLPKIIAPEADVEDYGGPRTRIYKKGVLVATLNCPSVYDYNLGSELRLDESRNASDWDVKYAVAAALRDAPAAVLAPVLKGISDRPDKAELLESCLASDYLSPHREPAKLEARRKEWRMAWAMVAGEAGVASSGNVSLDTHLLHKGLQPRSVPAPWLKALDAYDVPTEDKALTVSGGRKGETYTDATPVMLQAVDDVWALLTGLNLTNGREKPPVKGFSSIMDAGSQKLGEYRDGTVYLHTDYGTDGAPSAGLRQTALEEVVHHVTGATDGSRDLQDYLFRLVVAQVWSKSKEGTSE